MCKYDYKLYVKTLVGATIEIPYLPDYTIQNIKEEIQIAAAYPVDSQRLIFAGKGLEDCRLVSDYNITNESTLHLVLRMRA